MTVTLHEMSSFLHGLNNDSSTLIQPNHVHGIFKEIALKQTNLTNYWTVILYQRLVNMIVINLL